MALFMRVDHMGHDSVLQTNSGIFNLAKTKVKMIEVHHFWDVPAWKCRYETKPYTTLCNNIKPTCNRYVSFSVLVQKAINFCEPGWYFEWHVFMFSGCWVSDFVRAPTETSASPTLLWSKVSILFTGRAYAQVFEEVSTPTSNAKNVRPKFDIWPKIGHMPFENNRHEAGPRKAPSKWLASSSMHRLSNFTWW